MCLPQTKKATQCIADGLHRLDSFTRNLEPSIISVHRKLSSPFYWKTISPKLPPYSRNNPNGFIQCAKSQNILSQHIIQSKLEKISTTSCYSRVNCAQNITKSINKYMNKNILTKMYKCNPKNYLFTNHGCSSLFAPLAYSITKPNDIILTLTPFLFEPSPHHSLLCQDIELLPVNMLERNNSYEIRLCLLGLFHSS